MNISIGYTTFPAYLAVPAGRRYTMLFLPQMNKTFNSGVAWYGFPYSGGFLNQSKPAEFVSQLNDPLLIIHGTYDLPSEISDIYRYATESNATGKYFEMKVYQGEPHGFMITSVIGKLGRRCLLPDDNIFQQDLNRESDNIESLKQ